MAMNATTAANAATSTTNTKKASNDNSPEAIQERFMSLLVAQLKNQDPLAPMDNAQVTSQMAQLNTVTGIKDLNSTMENMAASFSSNQTVQATGMLGRTIMLEGNALSMKDGNGKAAFDMQQTADSVTVNILDSAGTAVRSIDLGAVNKGIHEFDWDGKNADGQLMKEGTYKFEIVASAAGQPAAVQSLNLTSVVGVKNAGAEGTKLLTATGEEVSVASVKQIF